MTPHYTNEFTFDLPADFADRTHHLFAVGEGGPAAFSLVATRVSLGQSETLERYEDRLLNELHQALPQFQLLESHKTEVAGVPALEATYSWTSHGVRLRQRSVSLFVDTDPRRFVVQLTATFRDDQEQQWGPRFREVLTSVRLRHLEGTW